MKLSLKLAFYKKKIFLLHFYHYVQLTAVNLFLIMGTFIKVQMKRFNIMNFKSGIGRIQISISIIHQYFGFHTKKCPQLFLVISRFQNLAHIRVAVWSKTRETMVLLLQTETRYGGLTQLNFLAILGGAPEHYCHFGLENE